MKNDRLAAFLFRLARDDVPFGVIEDHVRCVESYHAPDEDTVFLGTAQGDGGA